MQRIAVLLGSEIKVASKIGKGSCFSFRLSNGDRNTITQPETQTISQKSMLNKAVILLIDDDPAVLDASQMLLSLEEGFEILTASSPPEAYEILNKLTPNLIISDFHLNHKDTGINIIHKAKTADGQQIPAILVSGDTSPEMENISGENIVLMKKPVDPDKLTSVVRELLQNRV